MLEDLKSEILENICEDVCIGFYSYDDIYERASDLFIHDGPSIDNDWLHTTISREMLLHEKKRSKWNQPTDFEKLVNAFNSLNKLGVVSLHHAGFTKQDGDYDCRVLVEELIDLGYNIKGYCFYNEQDITGVIDHRGSLHIGFYSKESDEQKAIKIGQLIIDELESAGFQTSWDNSVNQRIAIKDFLWQKAFDGKNYSYNENYDLFPKNEVQAKEEVRQKPFWKFW